MEAGSARRAILKASVLTTGMVVLWVARAVYTGDLVLTRTFLLLVGLFVSTGLFVGVWEWLSPRVWSWERSLATYLVGMFAVIALIWAMIEIRVRYAQPASGDLNTAMAAVAEEAVATAKQRDGLQLSYEPDSVQQVEEILARLHEAHKAGTLSKQQIDREALMWGAYIGEVIKRLKGGTWESDHPVGGQGSLALAWGGGASFPRGWCGKRILNGPEDNVWHKFQFIVLEEQKPDSQPASSPAS